MILRGTVGASGLRTVSFAPRMHLRASFLPILSGANDILGEEMLGERR
jgi:hypothetical protein